MSDCDLDLEPRRINPDKVTSNIGTKCQLESCDNSSSFPRVTINVPPIFSGDSLSSPKACNENENTNVASKLAVFYRNLRNAQTTAHKSPVLTADMTEPQKVFGHNQHTGRRISVPAIIPNNSQLTGYANVQLQTQNTKSNANFITSNNNNNNMPPKPMFKNKFSLPSGLHLSKGLKTHPQITSSTTFCSTRYANNFNNILTTAAHSLPSGLNPALFYTNHPATWEKPTINTGHYGPTAAESDPSRSGTGHLIDAKYATNLTNKNEIYTNSSKKVTSTIENHSVVDEDNKINRNLLSSRTEKDKTENFPDANDECTLVRMPCKQCQCIIAVEASRIRQLRQLNAEANAKLNKDCSRRFSHDSGNVRSPYPSNELPLSQACAHLEPNTKSVSSATMSPGQHHRRQPSHGSSSGYSSNDSTLLFQFKQQQQNNLPSNAVNGEVTLHAKKVTNNAGWKIDLPTTRKPLFSWKFNLHKETSSVPCCNTTQLNNTTIDIKNTKYNYNGGSNIINWNNSNNVESNSFAHEVMAFDNPQLSNDKIHDSPISCLDAIPISEKTLSQEILAVQFEHQSEKSVKTGEQLLIVEDKNKDITLTHSTRSIKSSVPYNQLISPPAEPLLPHLPTDVQSLQTAPVIEMHQGISNPSPCISHSKEDLRTVDTLVTSSNSKEINFPVELLACSPVYLLEEENPMDSDSNKLTVPKATVNVENTTQVPESLDDKFLQKLHIDSTNLQFTNINNNKNNNKNNNNNEINSNNTFTNSNNLKVESSPRKNMSKNYVSPCPGATLTPEPSPIGPAGQSCPCLCHELCSFGLLVPVECFAPYLTLSYPDPLYHDSPNFYIYDPDGDQIYSGPEGRQELPADNFLNVAGQAQETGRGLLTLPLTLSSPPSTTSTLSSLESSSLGSILNNGNYENPPKGSSEADNNFCQPTISGSVANAIKLKWNRRMVTNFLIPKKFLSTSPSNTVLPSGSIANHNNATKNSISPNNLDSDVKSSGNCHINLTSSINAVGDNRVGMPLLIMENRPGNLPPKNPCEEHKHRTLYNQLIEASKKKEAKEYKMHKKLEHERIQSEERLAQIFCIWNTDILPHWENMKNTKKTFHLWGLGLPPSIRGKVWYLALTENQTMSDIEEKKMVLSSLDYLFPDCFDQTLTKHYATPKSIKGTHSNNNFETDKTIIHMSGIEEALHSELTHKSPDNLSPGLEKSLSTINLDVSRTFPHLCIFQHAGPYHERLKKLLLAYSLYNPHIGYVQGMSFIGAILLLNMELDDAFISFCNILELPCFQTFYTLDQINMKRYFDLYSEFLEANLPDLYDHFLILNFTPDLYLTDWIYTIYSKSLHLDVTCRIWDLFLREGETYLFKTALGILKLHEDVLLKMDFMQSAQLLTKLPENLSIDRLFKTISKIVI